MRWDRRLSFAMYGIGLTTQVSVGQLTHIRIAKTGQAFDLHFGAGRVHNVLPQYEHLLEPRAGATIAPCDVPLL